MEFLAHFGKSKDGKIIVFDVFTFNNLFALLLNKEFNHQNALTYILAECNLNAYAFQQCIHNKAYLKLTSSSIDFQEAGKRSRGPAGS